MLPFAEGCFSASVVLLAPFEEHALLEVVLATDLSGAFLAGGRLAAALKFELPGVVSPPPGQSLLLYVDVTLHPISREVDLRSCPG